MRELFEQHLDANVELCINGKLAVGERRFLTTKWVDGTWGRLKKQKDLIKHSFKKCGLSNCLDRSEDTLINIKNIERHKIPLPEKKFQMIEETDSEDAADDD